MSAFAAAWPRPSVLPVMKMRAIRRYANQRVLGDWNIRTLKDDDAAAAQAAGLHGAVGVGSTLWRVLAGDPQRDGTAPCR